MKIEQYLLEHYIDKHPSDVLSTVEIFSIEEITGILESIPTQSAALLLSQMDRFKAAKCLEKIKLGLAVKLIEQISVPNSAILLRLVSTDFCNIVLDKLPDKISQYLRRILQYPENTVGAFLNPYAYTLTEELTIKMALKKIKKEKPQLQSHLYVLNRNQVLVGYIELNKLISKDGSKSIQSIMNPGSPKILDSINISSLAEYPAWVESFSEIPVVDIDGVFLGILPKEVLKKSDAESNLIDQDIYKTGAALGELYKIGLTSFLRITSEITVKPGLSEGRQNL